MTGHGIRPASVGCARVNSRSAFHGCFLGRWARGGGGRGEEGWEEIGFCFLYQVTDEEEKSDEHGKKVGPGAAERPEAQVSDSYRRLRNRCFFPSTA